MKRMISILAILIIGLFVLGACTQSAPPANTQSDGMVDSVPMPVPGEDMDDSADDMIVEDMDDTKTFVLTGENFKFMMDGVEAPELRVNEGDTVRIEFTSTDGFHDWVVDEFGATPRVRSGEGDGSSTFVEFVADEVGTFEYYCSVGQHRANGMVGNLIVE
jgi:plastocyanin